MSFFGVELFSCTCNRYVVVDVVITFVVVAVCVPVFVTVPASRVYTGILLGVAVIFFCKLWRFLPSHRRWVEREARNRAEVLVSEWRTTQPRVAVPYTPTVTTAVAEMRAAHPPRTAAAAAAVDGGPFSPYGYSSRCPYYIPYHEPPYALPMMATSPPPPLKLLPAPRPSRSSISPPSTQRAYSCDVERKEEEGEEEERVWGQAPAPWRLPSPAESPFRTSPSRRLRSASLPSPSARATPRDAQRAFMTVGEPAAGPREPRSSRAASSPAHCHHPSRSPPPARDAGHHCDPAALLPLRSRSSREPSYVLPAHSLPASYGPPAASARSGSHPQQQQQHRHHRSHSPTLSVFDDARWEHSRNGSHRRRHRSRSSRHRAPPRSSASSYSVPSSASSLDHVNFDRDVRYAVRSHFSSAYSHG